jgi:hypothetical protein
MEMVQKLWIWKDMLRNPSLRWSADKLSLDEIEVEEVNLSESDFQLR